MPLYYDGEPGARPYDDPERYAPEPPQRCSRCDERAVEWVGIMPFCARHYWIGLEHKARRENGIGHG